MSFLRISPGVVSVEEARWASAHRVRVALAMVLPIGFVLFAVSVVTVVGPGRTSDAIADFSAPPVRDNRIAPGFTLPRLVGAGAVSLQEFSGHPLVVSFWASWCAPCREEAPFLLAAWRMYRSRGVRFLLVDQRDARSSGSSSLRREGIPFLAAFDARGELAARFGLIGIPTTFIIRPDGRIGYRITGRVDATNLIGALSSLVASG